MWCIAINELAELSVVTLISLNVDLAEIHPTVRQWCRITCPLAVDSVSEIPSGAALLHPKPIYQLVSYSGAEYTTTFTGVYLPNTDVGLSTEFTSLDLHGTRAYCLSDVAY